MALVDTGTPAEAAATRRAQIAAAEQTVEDATSRAIRTFLARCLREVRAALRGPTSSLTAADIRPVDLFTLGQAHGWWQTEVDRHVRDAVAATWRAGWAGTTDLAAATVRDVDVYLAAVTDRLSRTATPTIPDGAFDLIRVAVTEELATGSSTARLSRRIGAELSWDVDGRWWQSRYDELTGQLDAILDPLGPPGSPAREAARLGDRRVAELQAERSRARRALDADESTWKYRADRIARTETTAAYNAGSLSGMRAEGVTVKVWLATGDDRTRPSHLAASGQCVPVEGHFRVGGEDLAMPGDPSGSAAETVFCRCTMLAARSCDEAGSRFARSGDAIEAERQRRADG